MPRIGRHQVFAASQAEQIILAHNATNPLGVDFPTSPAQLGRDPRPSIARQAGANTQAVNLTNWEDAVGDFLNSAKAALDKGLIAEKLERIRLDNVIADFTDRVELTYKKKLRIEMRNDSGLDIVAGPCEWVNSGGLYLQKIVLTSGR